MRTERHTGKIPGQPARPVIPEKVRRGREPSQTSERHHCGECFGPRSATNDTLFCYRCLSVLFGFPSRASYWAFIRSERRYRVTERQRRDLEEA